MAFTTSNIQTGLLGGGPFRVYAADWTGNAGDASGTITLNGGRVYLCRVENQDADNPKEFVQSDISASGSTMTVTIHNHQNVTNGRLFIIFA